MVEMHLQVPVNTTAVVALKDILADTVVITDARGESESWSITEEGITLLSGTYRLKAAHKDGR